MGWLASHYRRMRTKYPDDQLIVLFDVDGTIIDLRHMVLRLLREYDQKHGMSYFRVLGLEEGFRRLRRLFPDAIIQCPVDFMAPLILAMPDEAERILSSATDWGVNRVSINWKNLLRRQVLDALESWGYEINIYNVPDLESFLKAALLLPTSLTADFSFELTTVYSTVPQVGVREPGWLAEI